MKYGFPQLEADLSRLFGTNELGITASVAPPANGLTLEKLREMQRTVAHLQQPQGCDLYGHDLPDLEAAYIIDRAALQAGLLKGDLGEDLLQSLARDQSKVVVIVPRQRLEEIYHAMKAHGVDVRLEPRYGVPPPDNYEETEASRTEVELGSQSVDPGPREMVASDIYPAHKRVWTGPGELERTGYIDPSSANDTGEKHGV